MTSRSSYHQPARADPGVKWVMYLLSFLQVIVILASGWILKEITAQGREQATAAAERATLVRDMQVVTLSVREHRERIRELERLTLGGGDGRGRGNYGN